MDFHHDLQQHDASHNLFCASARGASQQATPLPSSLSGLVLRLDSNFPVGANMTSCVFQDC